MDVASTSFILGYHGCDRKLAERVLGGKQPLNFSHNDYDWLGDGIYFWEHNAQRAFDFASEVARHPHPLGQRIKSPAVVGAVIDLGQCLNLLDGRFIRTVIRAHEELIKASKVAGIAVPENTGGKDMRSRKLDCAVLRTLHETREATGEHAFVTVRAAFIEGEPIYQNAGFASKNHIQVCVRNLRSIKGYFRPLGEQGLPLLFGA